MARFEIEANGELKRKSSSVREYPAGTQFTIRGARSDGREGEIVLAANEGAWEGIYSDPRIEGSRGDRTGHSFPMTVIGDFTLEHSDFARLDRLAEAKISLHYPIPEHVLFLSVPSQREFLQDTGLVIVRAEVETPTGTTILGGSGKTSY